MEQLYSQQLNTLLMDYPEEKQGPMRHLIEECFADEVVSLAFTEAMSTVSHLYGYHGQVPLAYHNPEHTLGVVLETINYVVSDKYTNLGIDEAKLLIIAASYHDIIQGHEIIGNNERASAVYLYDGFKDILTGTQLEAITILIEATTTIVDPEVGFIRPFMPSKEILRGGETGEVYSIGIMAEYLVDADVANIGNEKFWLTTLKIAEEYGMLSDELFVKFLQQQGVLLRNCGFYTQVASESNPSVDANSRRLQDYLSRGNISIESYIQEFLQ